jgi:branched-chain amino acid transport system ATP-binding protein
MTATMDHATLRFEDVWAGYGGATVLRGIDLTVDRGEVVALLGANGAGKTTTLRAITGLVRPSRGRVLLDGEDLADLSTVARARRGVAFVPDSRGLFFGLTVAEHFRIKPRGEGLDVDVVFEHFPELHQLRDRRAGLLSGGEQQMLAVGRALARRPRVLLLDELSFGLAPVIVERLLPVIRDYSKAASCAVLLVEQHVQLAVEIADRGYVLAHGELVLTATAERLRADHSLVLSSYLGAHA